MTTLGGIGHSLPYLVRDIKTATWIAVGVVLVELGVIAWIRRKYMDTPWSSAVSRWSWAGCSCSEWDCSSGCT